MNQFLELDQSINKSAALTSRKNLSQKIPLTRAQLTSELETCIEIYISLQVEGLRADTTVTIAKRNLRYFKEFFKAYTDTNHVSAWSSQITQRFIEDRIKKQDKPATVSMRLAFVCALGNWLYKERPEWFEEYGHPTKGAKPPVQDALAPKCLDTRQLSRLVDEAKAKVAQVEAEDSKKAAIKRPYRDYAILMLLIYTGIRRQEVCDLKLEQFQSSQLVEVKSKGNQYRNVRLSMPVQIAIQDYLEQERHRDAKEFPSSATIFLASKSRKRRQYHGHLSPRAINRIIERLGKLANAHLPEDRQFTVTPHMLRHSHAYAVLKKTKSLAYVQKRLGHQSQAYLARYTQMPVEEETQMLEELFE